MSHFSTIVFLDKIPEKGLLKQLEVLLHPYDENLEVEPYEADCYCEGDENCEECGGSERRKSTYNPKSRWDWWQVGGRWTGLLTGYDPREDSINKEVCNLCAGTGKRTDIEVANGCNGCQGIGIRVKWPTQWVAYQGDAIFAPDVEWNEDRRPFAFVTPDGLWYEEGKMGWWAIVTDEDVKSYSKKWTATVEKAVKENWLAVVVDCHI